MKILHVDYQQLRRYGKPRVSWAQKLSNGLIRNCYNTLCFSDRDVAAFEAPLNIRDLGKKKANQRLLETVAGFGPDLVIAGHCDIISNQTLSQIRQSNPNTTVIHCNNDPLFVPSNVERIKSRASVCDAIFVSTGRKELQPFENLGARVYHMPNPVDPAIETLDNSSAPNLPIDLLFCSNSNEHTKRLETVKFLKDALTDELNFKTFGSFGEPPVWGQDYDNVLAQTKMGLNINRQDDHYWYSSARMAQLAGNGILLFTHAKLKFDELFPPQTLVYFNDREDLLAQIRHFHQNDDQRKLQAANTRALFHQEFNASLYARYIVEAAMQTPFSHDYLWARDINLDGSMRQ